MEIKRVIICGLGALGLTYANKLKDVCELKILADENRIANYKKKPLTLNGESVELNYITPEESWDADLIIISTKSLGLSSAIEGIKNFVSNETIIISLINGVSSEEEIKKVYDCKVVKSYFIGHSAMKVANNVLQDGVGKIVIEKNNKLEHFFQKTNIDFEIVEDINYSQWIKLGVNVVLNQLSAIYEKNVGDLKRLENFYLLASNLVSEVKQVAFFHGIRNLENFEDDVFDSIDLIADDGKTSMLQDVLAKRKTEVEIFSGEIIKLANEYGISVPYNEDVYNKIKNIERFF